MSYVLGQFETMALPQNAEQAALEMIRQTAAANTPTVPKASSVPKILLGVGAVVALVTLIKK